MIKAFLSPHLFFSPPVSLRVRAYTLSPFGARFSLSYDLNFRNCIIDVKLELFTFLYDVNVFYWKLLKDGGVSSQLGGIIK